MQLTNRRATIWTVSHRVQGSFNPNDFQNYLKWAFLNPYGGAARAKLSGLEQWKSTTSSSNASALQRFVDEYPNSLYTPFARLRIRRLGAVGSGYVPVLSESMHGPLDAEKLATLNCEQLWTARNEIFYQLGRCFTSAYASSIFHTDQDLECRLASCQAIDDMNSTVENIMSPIQMVNALTILQQERKQGCRITPPVDACEKKP